LLTEITVNQKFHVGDLAVASDSEMRVDVSVLGPSWITADRVDLYANGVKIRDAEIKDEHSTNGVKAQVTWRIPRPKHDVHLIAIATGPGVLAPYWPIARPYQPSSPAWKPRVAGATNPVWVDADGDGKFTSARAYARLLVAGSRDNVGQLLNRLADFDEATAAQTASLLRQAAKDILSPEFNRQLGLASPSVQKGFAAYLATLNSR
jgi:hypothetical protein